MNGTILFDEDFFKSSELTDNGKLIKSKKIWIPPQGGKKGYYRDDPRDAKKKDVGHSAKTKGLATGMRVRVKAATDSKFRGMVAKIKEIAGNTAKLVSDAGKVFEVPYSQLEFAKSKKYLILDLTKSRYDRIKEVLEK